jgi:hypothetical protein
MTSTFHSGNVWVCKLRPLGKFASLSARMAVSTVLVAACLAIARPAAAQVVPDGDKGGIALTAGGTASGYEIGYGQQKLLGVAAIVDGESRRPLGFEAEARWLIYHQTDGLHVTTWSAGPRYRFDRGKFQFYGKGLIGVGDFTFPYNYAHGSYFVISPGGGVDYRYTRKISFRLADFEYQYWPQFTFGAMNSYGLSAGIRYHIF